MKKLIVILAMLVAMNVNAQWQPEVRLTNDPADSYTCMNNAWCVASSGTIVHIVWKDNRVGNVGIYYKRSTDAGISWGVDTKLSNDNAWPDNPSIAVSGPVVHVVWYDNRDDNLELYYKRSTDAGINWGADTRLTNNPAYLWNPSIAVSGLVVHVVWYDNRGGNNEIYYKRSTDAGINWGSDIRLTNDSVGSYYPSVAVFGSSVYVVWYNYGGGGNNDKIYFKRSTDLGVSWESETRLTNNTTVSVSPSIAVSGLIVHVVWHDYRDANAEIYYNRSTNGGVSWGSDIRLTNNPNFSGTPSISASDSIIHIVWQDERDGNREIYYKRSTNLGVSWGEDTRLTNYIGGSVIPSISVSGSALHVVWQDWRHGDREIYYKRNPMGNLSAIQNISTETPSKYSLSQNYPNPFNPVTIIRFSIPAVDSRLRGNDRVLLKVYDILGKEVQTLVNESLQPGTYETSFDGSSLTSGVYFYRLITNEFAETKKMLLIK